MKGFGATFRAGFLYLWRDPMSVILLTIFPILIILVLGNALEGFMSAGADMEPVTAAYVSEQQNDALYSFLTGEEAGGYLQLLPVPLEEANRLLENGDVDSILLPQGAGLEVLRSAKGRDSYVTLSLVDAYRQTAAAALISGMNGRNPAAQMDAQVAIHNTALGGKPLHAIDYYAVTMLVMILLYAGLNGMSLFGKNILGEFGLRLQASPASRASILSATLAASALASYLQGLITFAFTAVVYGVNWGSKIPLVLLTLFVVTLFSQALCIFLLLLTHTEAACTGVVQVLIWFSTFVSKGYTPIDFGAAERIFQYAPNALAHTVIFGAIYGGNEGLMMRSLAILCGMIILLTLGAFTLGRRRSA